MCEIIFIVEESPEGGYTAKAVGSAIFTEADTFDELKEMIRDAVLCHFEYDELPKLARLHFIKEEILTFSIFEKTPV
jgi:hypothetical protein